MSSIHHVVVAYQDDLEFKLEPSSKTEMCRSYADSFEWMAYEATADEVMRILASAVVLFQRGEGTTDQCLDTAIIWERG